jgi:hypothetical protein
MLSAIARPRALLVGDNRHPAEDHLAFSKDVEQRMTRAVIPSINLNPVSQMAAEIQG